jgi:hypothetical protein
MISRFWITMIAGIAVAVIIILSKGCIKTM